MTWLTELYALGVKTTRLVNDSRQVRPGDIFVAYRGETGDGRAYIVQALAAGASAALWEPDGFSWRDEWKVPNIPVPQLKQQIGVIASEFYGEPSQKLWMIGITGTNGKTSCCHWLAQALTDMGRKTAVIGTLGNGFPGTLTEAINTTPDPILLHGMLADYYQNGAQAVAMEVSSHGLAQGRVNGVKFDVAVLTNLSRDHLDYHGDMASYAAAKSLLFAWPRLKHAVLNRDDKLGAELALQLPGNGIQVTTYGFDESDVRGSDLRHGSGGLDLQVATPQGTAHLSAPVLGRFNAHNLLAVMTALLASGVDLQEAARALSKVQPVPGRVQQLGGAGQPLVVVDYAHTPDALEQALASLREHTQGRLICVFGCGGNRDKGKRPMMGEIASRLADLAVVTSDNPRNESPGDIIQQVTAAMSGNYHIEQDRAAAIAFALTQAGANDIVLIAGKGHEQYQEIGEQELPFSDAEVAAQALAGLREKA